MRGYPFAPPAERNIDLTAQELRIAADRLEEVGFVELADAFRRFADVAPKRHPVNTGNDHITIEFLPAQPFQTRELLWKWEFREDDSPERMKAIADAL